MMKTTSIKGWLRIGVFFVGISMLQAQQNDKSQGKDASVPIAWAKMTVQVMSQAPNNTPTYGSRALAYIGLTMYEATVPISPKHRSIIKSLCDTLSIPKPNKKYAWELALNAGQAQILKAFYGYTNKTNPIDSLEKVIYQRYSQNLSPAVATASVDYGRMLAYRIFEWAKLDGGHEGHLRNFPKDYVRPQGEGLWVPPSIGQSNSKIPMHPTWGQNRTFSAQNALLPLPKPLVYSTDTTTEYYKQYKEVADRKKTLTNEERAIVMWWGDDPTETCSPPGHSYNLATIAVLNSNADAIKAAETYARVGMAVADAFICCWKAKFAYMVQRPSSFIRQNFRHKEVFPGEMINWLPFFLEPPFPSFYSGHAVQSAATATVLTEMYGDNFSFTDATHAGRGPKRYYVVKPLPAKYDAVFLGDYIPEYLEKEVVFVPRHYRSFWESAKECAESRLMGGIHTRHDNDIGLEEGTKIGKNINALHWRK
ncbi:vanadium-dependent haloperoxidase [Runella limosa]|uniref:vanadium-dependent haloperoxidase n=1 Tax=Runella limosa TaxID=370978 RepID=UPI00048DC880|nr:vanadium-dependent haloperoxidase [Runella limosa]